MYSDRINSAYGFKITDISFESIGDLNGDGKINLKDIVRLKKILAGLDESAGASADVNNDGETNSLDLTALRKYILGI